MLVEACNKLEKSGKKVIKTCYYLQAGVDNSVAKEELNLLLDFLKGLAPKISTNGLFDINRKLFSIIFTATTSYLILILQFRNV